MNEAKKVLPTVFLCLLTILGIEDTAAAPTVTVEQNVSTPGNLRVTVLETGEMSIERSNGSSFVNLTQQNASLFNLKGSFLFAGSSRCRLGGYFQPAGGEEVPVGNTQVGSDPVINTAVNCTAVKVTWTQEVELKSESADPYLEYTWTITNTDSVSLAGLRFFHAHNAALGRDFSETEMAKGFADPSRTYIGIQQYLPPVINAL